MLSQLQTSTIQAAIGQYITIKQGFTSDVMLTGDVLKLHPQLYAGGTTPINTDYQIVYPPAAGVYDFTNISANNYKAKLKVINATTFEIQYSFFVVKPNATNGTAFNTGSFNDEIGLYLKHDSNTIVGITPINVTGFCEDEIEFVESGFIPGEDLQLQINANGTTNNNFFVGLIKEDAISNGPIVPNLVTNYAKISGGVSAVDDLPLNCFSDGYGFQEQGGQSNAGITILGSCLQANSSYKVYVVYFQDGVWKSCISGSILQAATNAPIIPTGTFVSMDEFGNEGEQCIKGLSTDIGIDLCFELDIADFDTQLTTAGLGGTWSDYFVSAKAFSSSSASAVSGKSLIIQGAAPTFCVYGFKPTTTGQTFVIIQLRFDYPTHTDFVNVPFDLTYNAIEIPLTVTVNGGVGEICDGETYTIDQTIDADCEIYQSINGSTWVPNSIITGQNVNVGAIPTYGVACFKVVCSDGADGPIDPECDCITTYPPSPTFLGYDKYFWVRECTDCNGNGSLNDRVVRTQYDLIIGNNNEDSTAVSVFGCLYVAYNVATLAEYNSNAGDLFSIDVNSSYMQFGCTLKQPTVDCSDCPDPDPNECKNYASINFDCNEETGEITISVNENFESPTQSTELLCSTDGGLSFIPCPTSIVGEQTVFLTYDASFTDGCAPIHLEQTIQCVPAVPCQNSRTIELVNTGNTLVITLTDTFDSGVLTDKLYVSLDNGANYTQYNPASSYTPISLAGDEKIVVYTDTIFDDGCNDLTVTKKLDLENGTTNPPGECAGYIGYSLTSAYDENTGQFTVTKTGNETNLVVNQILWTIGGANPFDENKSGIPYYGAVTGEGIFISRWKIKLPNCPELILDTMSWGKKCCETDVPEIVVNVEAPQVTVNVDACCDEEPCPDLTLTITCVNKTLTLTGAPVGSTITWTGPNGFTATGNNVMFPSNTPSGVFTATVVDGTCTDTATYNYTKPNAGTPNSNPILVQP